MLDANAAALSQIAWESDETSVRRSLLELFAGDAVLPTRTVADLHRIAELGSEQGMLLLQARAQLYGADIGQAWDGSTSSSRLDPKNFALLAYLHHPSIFDQASDLLALQTITSASEYVGVDEAVEPNLDPSTKEAFEHAAALVFERDQRSGYCRVTWYDDGPELNIIVAHGAPLAVTPAIESDEEVVISYRAAERAILTYNADTGRLMIAGVKKAWRSRLAEIFGVSILERTGFFAGEDCQNLYTLNPVEQAGLSFSIDHAYDPEIQRVEVVEIQVDRIATDAATGRVYVSESIVAKGKAGALPALRNLAHGAISFGPNDYRVGHIVLRVHLVIAGERPTTATVKLKPPSVLTFRRHRFEAKIIELLRRNGLCREREPWQTAAAAN